MLKADLIGQEVMPYVDPKTAKSSSARCKLFDVLLNKGNGDHALALGEWDGRRVLAMRWNGDDNYPGIGNPQSRGIPTWFVIPEEYYPKLIETLPEDKQTIARALLGL